MGLSPVDSQVESMPHGRENCCLFFPAVLALVMLYAAFRMALRTFGRAVQWVAGLYEPWNGLKAAECAV